MTASERIRLARENRSALILAVRAARQQRAVRERETAELRRLMTERRSVCG